MGLTDNQTSAADVDRSYPKLSKVLLRTDYMPCSHSRAVASYVGYLWYVVLFF